jgi:hypothetical protein
LGLLIGSGLRWRRRAGNALLFQLLSFRLEVIGQLSDLGFERRLVAAESRHLSFGLLKFALGPGKLRCKLIPFSGSFRQVLRGGLKFALRLGQLSLGLVGGNLRID